MAARQDRHLKMRKGMDGLMFTAVVFLLVIGALRYPAQLVPGAVQLLQLSCYIMFIALACLYGLGRGAEAGAGRYSTLFRRVSAAYIASALVSIAWSIAVFGNIGALLGSLVYPMLTSIPYVIVFFLMALGTYLYRIRRYRKIGILIYAVTLMLIVGFFESRLALSYFANDEEIITMLGAKALLAGSNPYAVSAARVLAAAQVNNGTSITILSSGNIAGSMDYPALFVLSFVPFYALAQPTLYNLEHVYMPAESIVFIFVMLLAIWNSIDDRDPLRPRYLLMGALIFLIPGMLLSLQVYLMLAIMVVAYSRLESRSAWLFLGLALSIQQELWFAVILMLLYSFNTYGMRKGIRDAAGALAVFVAINGYFIVIDPSTYLHALFQTLGYLLPNAEAGIGFFLFMHLNMLLADFSYLFMLSCAVLSLAFLYFNEKRLVPVFGMIPFLFLAHAQAAYYFFFAAMLVVAIHFKEGRWNRGWFREAIEMGRLRMVMLIGSAAAILAAGIAVIIVAHSSYVGQAGFSVSGQTAYISGNTLHYVATLTYHRGYDGSPWVLLGAYNSIGNIQFYGLHNTSLMNGAEKCQFPCSLNINILRLNGSGTYSIDMEVGNVSGPEYVSALIYEKDYAYQSDMTKSSQGS